MRGYTRAIGLLLLAAVVALFIIRRETVFVQLRQVSVPNLAVLVLAVGAHQLLNGLRFRSQLRVFGLSVPFREWFGLTVCNTMYSYYLPFRGGLAARAVYLKHRRGFSYTGQAALFAGASLVCLAVSAAAGGLFTAADFLRAGGGHPRLLLLFLLLFGATVGGAFLLAFLGARGIRTSSKKVNALADSFTEGLAFFRLRAVEVLVFSAFHVLSLLLLGLRLYLAFRSLGEEVDALPLLIVQSLTSFSVVLSLTPGNFGIKEGIITLAAGLLDVPPETAVLAALLDRAVLVAAVFPAGLLASHLLLRDLPWGGAPPPAPAAGEKAGGISRR